MYPSYLDARGCNTGVLVAAGLWVHPTHLLHARQQVLLGIGKQPAGLDKSEPVMGQRKQVRQHIL
jgi:hypothetical protein